MQAPVLALASAVRSGAHIALSCWEPLCPWTWAQQRAGSKEQLEKLVLE